jgi:hypothetical protein
MKKQIALWITTILHLQGLTQFPINQVLPGPIMGVSYGDTILNISAILKREGIRTIIVNSSFPQSANGFSKITMRFNENGMVESIISCVSPSKKTNGFCITDTALYDVNGLPKEFRSRDAG